MKFNFSPKVIGDVVAEFQVAVIVSVNVVHEVLVESFIEAPISGSQRTLRQAKTNARNVIERAFIINFQENVELFPIPGTQHKNAGNPISAFDRSGLERRIRILGAVSQVMLHTSNMS